MHKSYERMLSAIKALFPEKHIQSLKFLKLVVVMLILYLMLVLWDAKYMELTLSLNLVSL